MPKIDAHQHFWIYNPVRDSWIDEDMKTIRKDFMPADLQPVLYQHGFDGCVVVQSDQSQEENEFQLSNAAAYDFIKGIVGWVDLQAENIEHLLQNYSRFPLMKGFRHVLQGEADRALMLQPAFMRGISKLEKHAFTYDLLIYPDQLQYVPSLVTSFPHQPFVIDHIAKPDIKNRSLTEWKQSMSTIATYENVSCKVSGMVTEADWANWKKEDFYPYLDVLVETFGMHRLMFGSDWPVCLVAAAYEQMLSIVTDYFSTFSQYEQSLFFGGNATKFYKLK